MTIHVTSHTWPSSSSRRVSPLRLHLRRVPPLVSMQQIGSIPLTLRRLPQWVVWRSETRSGRKTKIPCQPSGQLARTNAPDTWCSFDEAVAAWSQGAGQNFDGIGFVFTRDDDLVGIDLDHALSNDGVPKPWAQELLDLLPPETCVEVSPSGFGLHALCEGKKPDGRCRSPHGDGGVEIYDQGRYFTITGRCLDPRRSQIVPAQRGLIDVELIRDQDPPPGTPIP